MTEIILFTKPDCQKCEYVKSHLPEGLDMRMVNTTEAEGLAEAAYYELLNRNLPILVVDDEVFEGSIIILNKLKELA
jgi:glutaredoxin